MKLDFWKVFDNFLGTHQSWASIDMGMGRKDGMGWVTAAAREKKLNSMSD